MIYNNIILMIIIVIILGIVITKKQKNHFTNKKYNVAICFFGLTRSLEYTLDSIKENILTPLKNANINYDIILHTYNLDFINSKRSGENTKLNTEEWKLLKPDYYKIDNQDLFDKSYDYNYVKSFGDAWNTNFENTINVVRQFNSLQKVWKLAQSSKSDYDCYLFIRPDLKYTSKLDISQVIEASNNNNVIYTPSWQKWGGLNDRMALGDYKSMSKYANRLDKISNYLETTNKPLHAENLLKFVIQKYKIKNKDFKLIGKRVRRNGKINHLDLKL